MKLKQEMIEKLRNGEIAVYNNGTWYELNTVLTNAFDSGMFSSDYTKDIYMRCGYEFCGYKLDSSAPTIGYVPVKNFFEEEIIVTHNENVFNNGDDCEVEIGAHWKEANFIGMDGDLYCVRLKHTHDSETFNSWLYSVSKIRHKQPKTIQEQANELINEHLDCFIVPSHTTAVRAAILTVEKQIEVISQFTDPTQLCELDVKEDELEEILAELNKRLK